MLERLRFIIYLLGIIPSGGLLSAALIERQKRHEERLAIRRRNRRYDDYDDIASYSKQRTMDTSKDRSIHPHDRTVSMVVGYLAALAWPALIALGIAGTVVAGIGYGVGKVAIAIGRHALVPFGTHVLSGTTRKFEAKIEQRALEPKPELEASKPLGNLEKLKT